MKRFFNFCLFLSLIICAFLCAPFSNSTTSALNNTYRIVNFYSGSTLLYSVQVENGTSLNDLSNSNILKNPDFSVDGVPSISNWYNSNSNASVVPNNSGVDISYTGSGATGYFIQDIDTSLYRGKNLTFSAYINNNLYSLTYLVPLSATGTGSSGVSTIRGLNQRFYIYNNTRLGVTFDISSVLQETAHLSYAKVEIGTSSTPYFSKTYIDKLYRNSNNLTSSDTVYWSQNAYGQFDFNTPINEDINLYGDSELYNLVNFYGEDRLTLLNSYIIPYGTMLKDFVDINELKEIYFENSDITNIDEYDILLTDDYYSYSNYFNFYFIITDSVDLYCTHLSNVINSGGDYTPSKSSDISLFTSLGSNLLNDINLNSITFEYNDILINWVNDGYIFKLYLYSLPNSLTVGEYFDIYTDSYGNKFYYKYIITQGDYSYNTLNYSYEFTSYLYRVNLIDINNVYIPPFNFNLFITYDTSSNKYVYLDNNYYFYYDDSFFNRVYIEYDIFIDYNMNYYYADYFGFSLNIEDLNAPIGLRLYDNLGYSYGIYGATSSDKYFLLNSSEFQSSYINKIRVSTSYMVLNYMRNIEESSYDNLISSIEDNTFHLQFINPKIFFYNPTETNGNNLVPTTPTSLYKQKANWYDFGTDIYNIFIYLLFEAPIISNITSIIYIIISLLINVINLIIGAFSSVKSSIFIAMILGFLLFKFVIKKFTGGSS